MSSCDSLKSFSSHERTTYEELDQEDQRHPVLADEPYGEQSDPMDRSEGQGRVSPVTKHVTCPYVPHPNLVSALDPSHGMNDAI